METLPLSVGIETKGGIFTRIIDRGAELPVSMSQVFTTADDNQTSVLIQMFQGEHAAARSNRSLGTMELVGIAPAPHGVPQIEVTFEVDRDGQLTVSAIDRFTGLTQSFVGEERQRLVTAPDEIARMLAEAAAVDRDEYNEMVEALSPSSVNLTTGTAGRDIDAEVELAAADAAAGIVVPLKVQTVGNDGKPHERALNIRIPAGIQDGQRLRLTGRGAESPDGGRTGDLYVLVHVKPSASVAARTIETKVILVGEGTVGKTSLIGALRGEVFVDRIRTHGIETHTTIWPDEATGTHLILRFWDFGGQSVYRPTHQFFFSADALYLVVWNARAGEDKDDVRGWVDRIRARVGGAAKIMIVATHIDEMAATLDYDALQRANPGVLCGRFGVDNRSGTGVAELRAAIAAQATAMSTTGTGSEASGAAQAEILDRGVREPYMSYYEFVAICGRHGLTDIEADLLAQRLHRSGLAIYHGADEALRDILILDPEWLSKAIGYVLQDAPTVAAHGVLDHARLPEIWAPRPGEPPYGRHQYPYFLRLMEKFDISFRLDDGQHSLVTQLVPPERGAVPWRAGAPVPDGQRGLALVLELAEPVQGLVSALTVRLSYADTARHWRDGIFLRHPNPAYSSEALIELERGTRLTLDVRAPSPDLFFHVLRDSIEHLLRLRWPGLRYDVYIPCRATEACRGRFRLDGLVRAREAGTVTVTCPECFATHDVTRLLTGFSTAASVPGPSLGHLEAEIRALRRDIGGVRGGVDDLQSRAADNAHAMRRLLALVSTEITDCPRLFTLRPVDASGLRRLAIHQDQLNLTLWCEHPDHWHPVPEAIYVVTRSKDWFRQLSRYTGPIFEILRRAVPVAGAFAGVVLTSEQLEAANRELELMGALLEAMPATDEAVNGSTGDVRLASAPDLRGIREMLRELDRFQRFGGLSRVQAASGEVVWVCPEHLSAYEPGLPTVERAR